MNLVIDTGAYHPSDAVERRIRQHAEHLAQQCDDIEECRVMILPLQHHPPSQSGFIARLDIVTSDGRMVIGDHAGWPASDRPGGAVDMSFRRAFEVMRQHARHRRGDEREHKTTEPGERRVRVTTDGAAGTLRQEH